MVGGEQQVGFCGGNTQSPQRSFNNQFCPELNHISQQRGVREGIKKYL